jgi:hypothetical protein
MANSQSTASNNSRGVSVDAYGGAAPRPQVSTVPQPMHKQQHMGMQQPQQHHPQQQHHHPQQQQQQQGNGVQQLLAMGPALVSRRILVRVGVGVGVGVVRVGGWVGKCSSYLRQRGAASGAIQPTP